MTSPAESVSKGERMMQRLVQSAGAAFEPAADMADLAEVVRSLLAVQTYRDTRVRLGGGTFDVVITSSSAQARFVVALMDEIQDGCGPVIEDPGNGWLYWLVPPGSAGQWAPHSYAVCLGAPHTITLPSLNRADFEKPCVDIPCADGWDQAVFDACSFCVIDNMLLSWVDDSQIQRAIAQGLNIYRRGERQADQADDRPDPRRVGRVRAGLPRRPPRPRPRPVRERAVLPGAPGRAPAREEAPRPQHHLRGPGPGVAAPDPPVRPVQEGRHPEPVGHHRRRRGPVARLPRHPPAVRVGVPGRGRPPRGRHRRQRRPEAVARQRPDPAVPVRCLPGDPGPERPARRRVRPGEPPGTSASACSWRTCGPSLPVWPEVPLRHPAAPERRQRRHRGHRLLDDRHPAGPGRADRCRHRRHHGGHRGRRLDLDEGHGRRRHRVRGPLPHPGRLRCLDQVRDGRGPRGPHAHRDRPGGRHRVRVPGDGRRHGRLRRRHAAADRDHRGRRRPADAHGVVRRQLRQRKQLWTAAAWEARKDSDWIRHCIEQVAHEGDSPPLPYRAFTEAMRSDYSGYARAFLLTDRRAHWVVCEALDILWLCWSEAAASANLNRYAWQLFRSRVMLRTSRHADGQPDLRAAVFSTREVRGSGSTPGHFMALTELIDLFDVLTRLPDDQMDLTVLHYLCGIPAARIAHILGMAPALTHAVDHHARATLDALVNAPIPE